jgi:hypothetical protein
MKTFRLVLVCLIVVALGAVALLAIVPGSTPTAQAASAVIKVASPCHSQGC